MAVAVAVSPFLLPPSLLLPPLVSPFGPLGEALVKITIVPFFRLLGTSTFTPKAVSSGITSFKRRESHRGLLGHILSR